MSAPKSIFITGAASGIGRACAVRFAKAGWFVGIADIDMAGAAETLSQIGADNGAVLELDVRDRAAWTAALARFAEASGGRMDVLLNNAGLARWGFLEDQTDADVDLQIDVNVKGVINGARAGLELLKATPGSKLINVASCAGLAGAPNMSVYAATKFAVRGLSESLDAEFSRFGVGVACIMPWFVETPILDKNGHHNRNIRDMVREGAQTVYPVTDAAEVIWQAAHGDQRDYVVGAQGRRLRTMARLAPGLVRKQLRRAFA